MGDTIEFVTRPRHQCSFYKVSNNAFFVDIKGSNNACIALSKKPDFPHEVEVLIGSENNISIKRRGDVIKIAQVSNILSMQEYRRFWITWNRSSIFLGQGGSTTPIIAYVTKVQEDMLSLSYVTFSGNMSDDVIYWRFEVPPLYLKNPKVKSIDGGEVQWLAAVAADTQLPDDAVIGGFEQETLYIIRAHYRGSLIPGKFVPSKGVGYVSWRKTAIIFNEFEVLCGNKHNYKWVPTEGNKIPVNAIEGGYSEDCRELLYVGRAYCDGHIIPGKVQASRGKCYVWTGGKEVAFKQYEIMVSLAAKPRCVNSFFKTPGIMHLDHM